MSTSNPNDEQPENQNMEQGANQNGDKPIESENASAPNSARRPTRASNNQPPPVELHPSLNRVAAEQIPIKKDSRHTSSKSSRFRQETDGESAPLRNLPLISRAPEKEREMLFIKKVNQCRRIFDFNVPLARLKEKEVKRDALSELMEYIVTSRTFNITPAIYEAVISMVSINLFRPLPPRVNPSGLEFDPEEDEPILELAWPHIQFVYEFFLRFVECPRMNAGIAQEYINKDFISQLLLLFDSEDPRERDFLKTTLHRIYSKFFQLRPCIRKQIRNIFLTFSYESQRHNGIAELLEILGSIINGFALPLKHEHREFLEKALLPLHKPKPLTLYHQQLRYCTAQYIDKDRSLSRKVVDQLLKYWPHVNSTKEIIFLSEVEEILLVLSEGDEESYEAFLEVQEDLFKQIARSIANTHFQVAEKALTLWHDQYIWALIADNINIIFPILFPTLYEVSQKHWNKSIRAMSHNALKQFMSIDQSVFNEALRRAREIRHLKRMEQLERYEKWKKVYELAHKKDSTLKAPPPQEFNLEEEDIDGISDDQIFEEMVKEVRQLSIQETLRRKSLLPMDGDAVDAIRQYTHKRSLNAEFSDSDDEDYDDEYDSDGDEMQ